MRILATGMGWFSEQPGGLNRYFSDYLCALEKRHLVQALVASRSSTTTNCPSYVEKVPLHTVNPLSVRAIWRGAVEALLHREEFDVLNPHFAYYGWFLDKADLNIPIVTHFHGPWAYEGRVESSSSPLSQLKFRAQKMIERRLYRQTDQFIVLSYYFKTQLESLYGVPPERIHIVPGAVDVYKFRDSPDRGAIRRQLTLPSDKFVLLSVRRLARRMGLDRLIRAFSRLRESFAHLHLVIVGGGELYKELKNLVSELKLENSVTLTNRVPEELLPLYYQAADLMVVPSVALEGFGLVTVEAMASGTPVVGTPIGGTKEILEKFDKRLLSDGATETDLYNRLGAILNSPQMLPSRTETRDHVVSNYTWDVAINQIEKVFAATTGTTRSNYPGIDLEGR